VDCGQIGVWAGRVTGQAVCYVDSRSVLRPVVLTGCARGGALSTGVTRSRHKIFTAKRSCAHSPDVRRWMSSVTCS
jgi:hypothetical protein